jgi:hypothetical protein
MTTEQCSFCWDDIVFSAEREKAKQFGTPEDELPGEQCWWRSMNSHEWTPSKYCFACVTRVRNDNFNSYIESIKTATCPKQLRRLIEDGPPIYVSDPTTFPVTPGDHVHEFKRVFPDGTEEIVTARLVGSVIGEEREQLWRELQGVAYEVGKKLIQKMTDPVPDRAPLVTAEASHPVPDTSHPVEK